MRMSDVTLKAHMYTTVYNMHVTLCKWALTRFVFGRETPIPFYARVKKGRGKITTMKGSNCRHRLLKEQFFCNTKIGDIISVIRTS